MSNYGSRLIVSQRKWGSSFTHVVDETYLHLAKISFLLITTLVFCRNSIRCCGKSLKHSSTIFCVLPHFSTWASGGGGFWSVSFREWTRVNNSTKRRERGTSVVFAISIINRIRLLLIAISLWIKPKLSSLRNQGRMSSKFASYRRTEQLRTILCLFIADFTAHC